MPEMDNITNRNFADLFSGEVQYIIPFFQRNYVWGSRNWNALYADIQDGILEELGHGESVQGHEHFFGPIVVREAPGHNNPKLKAFDVIDGQQRITTVYLMLAYFRRQLLRLKGPHHPQAQEYYDDIGPWLENKAPRAGHDYDRLKILSFKNDRLATWFAVRSGFRPNDTRDNIPQTPDYREDSMFYNPHGIIPHAFEKWLDKRFGKMDAQSIWRWTEALTQCLQVVWIPLQPKDNPQAIFESLNDKGTPLGAIDLLVNYIFRPIIKEEVGNAHEQLHSEKWLATQTKIARWRAGNFEEYLRILFSIGKNKMEGRGRKLYTSFKHRFPNITPEVARDKLDEIFDSSRLYGCIIGEEKFDPQNFAIDGLLTDIRHTGMHSCRPFLLAVLQAVEDGMPAEDAKRILREVLTLLVRCKIVQRQTTQYDALFPPLLARIQNEPDMVEAMHKEILNPQFSQFWISNREFRDGLVARPLYRRPGDRDFTRLVLRKVDECLTAELNDNNELPNYDTLDTVEHIAPQTPTDEWLAETGCPDVDAYNTLPIHTIGNLCLRNQKANSGMGQLPFADKQKYCANSPSVLAMKIAEREGPWNKAAIEQRSRELAEHAVKIWAWSTVRE